MKKTVFIIMALLLSAVAYAQKPTEAKVRVTFYWLVGKTASGVSTHDGVCAVSPDLEKKGFKLGEYITLEGYGKFLIADRTAKWVKNTVDIWLPKPKRIKNGKDIKATLVYNND